MNKNVFHAYLDKQKITPFQGKDYLINIDNRSNEQKFLSFVAITVFFLTFSIQSISLNHC